MHWINRIGILFCFWSFFLVTPGILGEVLGQERVQRLQQDTLKTLRTLLLLIGLVFSIVSFVSVFYLSSKGLNSMIIPNYNSISPDDWGPDRTLAAWGAFIGFGITLGALWLLARFDKLVASTQLRRNTLMVGIGLLVIGTVMQFVAA